MPARIEERTAAARDGAATIPLAREAAGRAAVLRFADIPPEVVDIAETHLLDQLGVGLLAAALPRNRPLVALVSGSGSGGSATALGFATPAPTGDRKSVV